MILTVGMWQKYWTSQISNLPYTLKGWSMPSSGCGLIFSLTGWDGSGISVLDCHLAACEVHTLMNKWFLIMRTWICWDKRWCKPTEMVWSKIRIWAEAMRCRNNLSTDGGSAGLSNLMCGDAGCELACAAQAWYTGWQRLKPLEAGDELCASCFTRLLASSKPWAKQAVSYGYAFVPFEVIWM